MDKMNNFHFEIITILSIFIVLVTVINPGYSETIPSKDDSFAINVTMNNYQTTREDEYACVQYKLPDEELMIVGYSPLISMNSAHHMLTYACNSPASNLPFWTGSASCGGEQTIVHGWARNAPPLTLPEDVGFAVGRNTPYKYIVLVIHYMPIMKNDNSGNQLILSRKLRKYQAGVMLGGTSQIFLQAKTHTVKTPFSCNYGGPPISIFAVRVHAHKWGRVNSLYRVRDGQISQVVKSDPQWPQSFYPLPSEVDIKAGDAMVGQCVYDNDDDRAISVGSTHNDEMCNVYVMYSYEPVKSADGTRRHTPPPTQSCYGGQDTRLINMIPPDSVVPPLKPADIGGTTDDHHAHAEHAMDLSPANLYMNIETWPDVKALPPQLGEIGGIALNNANDELVVFYRGQRKWEFKYFNGFRFRNDAYGPIPEDTLIHVNTRTGEGKFRWGANMFYMPHGLTIDYEGNFWLTDIAMHQVFMFKPNDLKQPALTVGKMFEPGAGPDHLCRPADVVVAKNGDFFVADGYCNNRIIKFNRKGEYIMEWGLPMSGRGDKDGFPLPNEWNIVHSVALNEDGQLICGADRENFRIQCFNSTTGEFLRQIRVEKKGTMGAIYAIEFAPNANGTILFAVTGGAQTANKKVYMINAENGDILTSFDSNPHLLSPHDIAVSKNAREIYVGELATSSVNALHKFEISKQKELPTQTFSKRINFNDKNFRLSLIIFIALATPILLAVIVGCIIRIRNMRRANRLNTFLTDVKNGSDNDRSSVIRKWMNRRFERLQQESDGENEPLDSNIGDDSNNNSGDETVTVKSKPKGPVLNNKNTAATYRMSDNL